MTTVPQEIIDIIIGFLAEDRASLLTCSLVGNRFCSPTRTHLFANIEVNSLQRFQGLLELSTTSITAFSSARTISVREVDAWVIPEILPSLLFLPLLAPFPHVDDFRIDGLTLPGHIREEALTMLATPPLHMGERVGMEEGWRSGTSQGIVSSTNESLAGSPDLLASPKLSTASLKALSLRNCQVPSLRWFLRYASNFPDLESLSLIDLAWRSVGGEDADQSFISRCCPVPRPSNGLSELTLETQDTPLASSPRLLFESLSGSLRILRLMHIDTFLTVDEGSIHLDPSFITLSPLNFLTHLTLPPIAVWLQAKQRWLPDLLATITSTSNLKELNIHLLFSPIAIKAQLDSVAWSMVDLILGRKWGEGPEIGNMAGAGRRGNTEGYIFTDLDTVKITSADFNPGRPPLGERAKSRIKGLLMGYMPRIHERRVLRVPLGD